MDSTEDFFSAVGETVKNLVRRCPDGEVGPRRLWVCYQWPVLRATGFLEKDGDNAALVGACLLRLRSDVRPEAIGFGELGYAREARISYQDFVAARQRGQFTAGTRFQVCLPTPWAVIETFIAPKDALKILPAYERAMIREVDRICAAIPHSDLAIQWDVAIEMIQWDGRFPYIPSPNNMRELFAGAFARIGAAVPGDVELGYHLCYGDLDAQHAIEPADLGKAVELANLITSSVKRPTTWVHMPVPINRDDAGYFAPLVNLSRSPTTELYLGLVHEKDAAEGTMRRMKAAGAFTKDFGIATECGMGRVRTPAAALKIMRIHAEAAQGFSP